MLDTERELLHRLLTQPLRGGGEDPVIRVGEVPPDFPLPFPPNTRILGSLERRVPPVPPGAPGMHLMGHSHAELDTLLPVAAWLAEYRAGLGEEWEEEPMLGFERSGFLPAESADSLSLYSSTLECSLRVDSRRAGEVTELTAVCSALPRDYFARHAHQPFWPRIALRVPAGVSVQPSGGGGGGAHFHFGALLRGEVSGANLLSHFAAQLAAAGWSEGVQRQGEELNLGVWFKPNGEQGVLSLRQLEPSHAGEAERAYQASLILTGLPPAAGARSVTPLL